MKPNDFESPPGTVCFSISTLPRRVFVIVHVTSSPESIWMPESDVPWPDLPLSQATLDA